MAIQALAPPMEGFRRGTDDRWLAALLAAAALANRMARVVWAVVTRNEACKAPLPPEKRGGRAMGTRKEMKKEFFRGSAFA